MTRHVKKSITGIAVLLTFLMMLSAFTPVRALFGKKDTISAVAAFGKSDVTGNTISFTAQDFSTRVSGKEKLSAIVISNLPECGILRLAGRELLRGEAIELEQLSTLCYVPAEDMIDVHTSFDFIPVFSKSGAAAEAVTVSLNLSETANSAPIAHDISLPTYAGVTLCGSLNATDADGDACTFDIVTAPKRGTAEITDCNFSYTPTDGKTGKDSFEYTATDAYGNVSGTATVTIDVQKRAGKDTFVYTDMADSAAHYSALKLRDADILCGETIGNESFLYPAKPVTRAEFVALVAAVTELALPTASVGTGLSDNDTIPVWAQPYVAAAITSGVVVGEQDGSGNRIFRAEDSITRAEAAAIIDRALDLPDDGREMAFSDTETVPAWAAQYVVNVTAAQVLPVFSDNTVRCNTAVTREDAVQMIYQMLEYQENNKPSGLFGLFG